MSSRVFNFVILLTASLTIPTVVSNASAAVVSGVVPESDAPASVAPLEAGDRAVQPPELQNRESIQKTLAIKASYWLDSRSKTCAVTLRLAIDEDGRVRGFEILESTGNPFLDREVRAVVPDMRFSPALEGNRPVSSVVEIELRLRPGQPR